MNPIPDPNTISSVSGGIVMLGNEVKPTFILDGQPVTLPSRSDLLAYTSAVERSHRRWADQPEEPQPPLYDLALPLDQGPNAYIDTRGLLLPMRVSEFSRQAAEVEAEPKDLVGVILAASRTILVGEPGSGKTTALERLAWLLAASTVQTALRQPEAAPVIPLYIALKQYCGEADLIPLVEGALNSAAVFAVNTTSARLLLHAQDVRFVLLLDGLNEFGRYTKEGRTAIQRMLANYPQLAVHATCRTADFNPDLETNPETAWLPTAQHWQVQQLVDSIRYWDDEEGESDVRLYLRRHLGNGKGKRLWDRLHGDERLRTLALNPLLLFMLKEVGGAQDGDLPADRGALVRSFVHSTRTLGAIDDKHERRKTLLVLESLGWRLQQERTLQCSVAVFDAVAGEISGVEVEQVCRLLVQHRLLLEDREQYRLLHQLVQEYAAAAHLVRQPDAEQKLAELAVDEWWRETVILALWLEPALQRTNFLQNLMRTPAVDLRVRVAAATLLGRRGLLAWLQQEDAGYIEPPMVKIPGGRAQLGGDDPDAYQNELPSCWVALEEFDLAVFPVTNAEYGCFMAAGGYDDPSLWTADGQAWLKGELALDTATEEQYRNVHRVLRTDIEQAIAKLREGQSFSDEDAAQWRVFAGWDEDEFVKVLAQDIVGEQQRQPAWWDDSRFNQPTQPVVSVTWYEAMAYAAWLSRVSGRCYRLPSEAQWEWAARRSRRRYPWGPAWDEAACNWSGSRLNAPAPVGVFRQGATPDGLEELAGNVYEWTLSLYQPYPYLADDGRENLSASGLRVLRGGSWYTSAQQVRCAYRDWLNPGFRNSFTGFRLARILS